LLQELTRASIVKDSRTFGAHIIGYNAKEILLSFLSAILNYTLNARMCKELWIKGAFSPARLSPSSAKGEIITAFACLQYYTLYVL
jgi:hypothetical protein